MSSFSDYYKKWKSDNGITEDASAQSLTDHEKAQNAGRNVDRFFEGMKVKQEQRKQEEQQKRLEMQKNRKANFESYLSNKSNAMNKVSQNLQEQKKEKEEQQQKFKDYLGELSKVNRQKQGVQSIENNRYQGNRSVSEEVLFPTNTQFQLANSEEIKQAKDLKSEDIYRLTNGKVDTRNQFQKVKSDVAGVAGNVAMGVESVVPNIAKYMDSLFSYGSKKAVANITEQILSDKHGKEDAKQAGEIVGSLLGDELYKNTASDFYKANEDLNSEERKQWRRETIQSNTNKTTNPLSNFLSELAPNIGSNLVPMATTAVNPVVGGALFMTSVAGGYLDEAKERGMNEGQAIAYATIMGGVEGATESIISSDMISKAKKIATGTGLSEKVLNSFGVNVAENFVQESLTNPINEIVAEVTGGKEASNWDNLGQRMLEDGVKGAISAFILSGASVGVGSAVNVMNKNKSNQRVTEHEIATAIKDTQSQVGITMEDYLKGAVQAEVEKVQSISRKQNIDGEQIDSLANNKQPMYNSIESEGGINEQSQFTNQEEATSQSINKRGMVRDVEAIGNNERGRSTSIIDNTKGKNDGSRVRQDNISKEGQSIELAYEDNKNILKTMEYAKKNPYVVPSKEIQEVKKFAEELGVPLNMYSGEEGNIHIGLTDGNEVYLDINQKNISKEDGSLMNRFSHELLHFVKRNNKINAKDSINELTGRIVKENPQSIKKLVENKGYDTNEISNKAFSFLAEEVLGDYSARHISGYDIDYSLPEDITYILNTTIDDAITELKLKNTNNIQEVTNTSNLLNKVEVNTQSLGYKSDQEGKQRKHYKSVMKSDQVGEVGKQLAKSLLEKDVYTPISNVDTIATVNENMNRNGVDNTYIAFRNKVNSNERITLQDIATGERLIQVFSQNGEIEKVNGLIQDVAILGTELGQQVQAMSLIKKMSTEGQLMYLNKVVERTNIKENTDLKITDEMSKKILEAKNQTELEEALTDISVELGQQLPVSIKDKIRSWRYLSMLGNPKTHIKNLGANVFMNLTQQIKNKVGGATEDVVGVFKKDLERTKTLKPANKDQRTFAKQDAEFMKDKIDGGGKYDIKNVIQNSKRQFDNKVLNEIANFNSDMLELEDNIFLKKAYRQAMQNYMSANKLTSTDMEKSTVLQKAREYASLQAQEATFHQFNSLAQRLTEIENKGGIAGKATEAILPFKKTPMNIAKSAVEYSPIGLAKSLTYDITQINKKTKDYKIKLEKGVISQEEYDTGVSKVVTSTIDNMAKGLTGTSLAILGYALADMGLLKAGNDGEDDEFKEKLGEQEYAIRIGDSTYTLDWVSPSAIPMFVGSTVHKLIHSQKEDNSNLLNSLMTASAKTFEPMTDMSMLQGLTGAISSYEQGSSNMLLDLGASAVSSYFGQFVPTALGQVAKVIDDKERDTSSTEKGLAKKVDQFTKQQMAKIPVVSKMLPVKKDIWGNDKKRDGNFLVRTYEVAMSPYNRKKIVESYTDKELLSVFEKTGENVLPSVPNKDLTINGEKYRLSSEEYNKAKGVFGQNSKRILDNLVKTKEYKGLSQEKKAKAIENVYSYTKEQLKVDYAKSKKKEIETSHLYNTLKELKQEGGSQSDYLSYTARVDGMKKDKQKNEVLAKANYSEETKSIIYKNAIGKEDELYNDVLERTGININEYLNYKLQEFNSDKKEDGTVKGETISGSKKKKVYDYINTMGITRDQKLLLLGTQYKLSSGERTELANIINKLPNTTKSQKMKVYEKMQGFTVFKNGTINW